MIFDTFQFHCFAELRVCIPCSRIEYSGDKGIKSGLGGRTFWLSGFVVLLRLPDILAEWFCGSPASAETKAGIVPPIVPRQLLFALLPVNYSVP
jgi:hypothetical protein